MSEYKEKMKKKWLDNNCSRTISSGIIPMNPEIGFYIKVDNLNISEDFFPEEFKEITKAYFSVLKKLDDHLKEKIRIEKEELHKIHKDIDPFEEENWKGGMKNPFLNI